MKRHGEFVDSVDGVAGSPPTPSGFRRATGLGAAVCACLLSLGCDGTVADAQDEALHAGNLHVEAKLSSGEHEGKNILTMVLTAENRDPEENLRGIEVLIPLSAKLRPISWVGNKGQRLSPDNPPDNLFSWALGTLRPGERAKHEIRLEPTGDEAFIAYNAALAFARNERGTLRDNGRVVATPVAVNGRDPDGAPVNLRLTASGPGEPVAPGEIFQVRMFVENLSDNEAHDVSLVGCIDSRAETPLGMPGVHTEAGDKRLFTWHITRIIGHANAWLDFKLRAKEGVAPENPSTLFTSAFLTGREHDPDLDDNWALLPTTMDKNQVPGTAAGGLSR